MEVDFFARLACYSMVEDETYIYYYANEKNLLCRLNKHTIKNEILVELDEKTSYTYSSIQKVNEKLIVIPFCAEDILVYELQTNVLYRIPVDIPKNFTDINDNGKMKFWKSVVFGDFVYLLGFCYPAIIKFNVVTMESEYLTEWYPFIEKRKINGILYYFIHGEVIKNQLWISCGCSNTMLKLDLISMEFEHYVIPGIDIACGVFTYDKEYFWICENGGTIGKLIRWKPNEKKETSFPILKPPTNEFYTAHTILNDEKKLHIFPFTNNAIYQLNKESGKVEKSEINIYCDCDIYGIEQWKIMAFLKNKTCIRYITGDYIWHTYDLKSKSHISYEVKIEDNHILWNCINRKRVENEKLDETYGLLPMYLNYILNRGEI